MLACLLYSQPLISPASQKNTEISEKNSQKGVWRGSGRMGQVLPASQKKISQGMALRTEGGPWGAMGLEIGGLWGGPNLLLPIMWEMRGGAGGGAVGLAILFAIRLR